ncbi:MAG: efflux RND transporter periplasmic adaptor subunit [Pseudobdellovibrionaceae bacterium]
MKALRTVLNFLSRHKIISSIFLLVIIASSIAIRFVLVRSEGVTSGPIKRGILVDAVYGIGTVVATHSYSVKPGVTSTISELFVKEGDSVKKGDNLVRIDNVTYKAPFKGVINYLPFKVGENVFPQGPVLVLTDLSNRYMVVNLEQQSALRVRPGQTARISFDSIRQQKFNGVVESTYSYNGSFLARINIENLPPEILPDMTADVAIVIREVPDALIIPAMAYEDGYVWVRRGQSLPYKTPIKIGVVDQALVQVISGDLKDGDQVMIRRRQTQ